MSLGPEDLKALAPYRRRGRIPVTPERLDLERKRSIRELVFGVQDGVLTALGMLVGVDGATGNASTTLIATGLVAAITGMLSMGMGEYLGSDAEQAVVRAAIAAEDASLEANPEHEFLEQVAFLQAKGLDEELARSVVRALAKNPEVWRAEMLRDEYGIDINESEAGGAFKNGAILGGAFGIGSLIPVLTYALFPHLLAVSIAAALVLLGIVGATASWVSQTNPLAGAAKLIASGSILAIISATAGSLLPALLHALRH